MTDFLAQNPVAAVIIGGEIGFWALLFGGLIARYLLRRRRLGAALLIGVPLIDVVVLVATFIHLASGAEADFTHGLAAIYLGFSVIFGPSMIRWADQRFAHRFAGGPPPWKPPKGGPARTRYEWREFGKLLVAWAISAAIVGLFILVFGERAQSMLQWPLRLIPLCVIWFAVGPMWATLSAREQPVPGPE